MVYFFLHLLLLTSFFLYTTGDAMCGPKNDKVCSPSTIDSFIPENEINKKMIDAMRGDKKAAYELSRYFNHRLKDNEELFWATIGAENDSLNEQYRLVIITMNSNKELDIGTRGIFWLHKLTLNGHEGAKEWLNKLGLSLYTTQPPNDALFQYRHNILSENEVAVCKEGALKGNGRAAFILAKYYSEVINDVLSAEYWYRIGAQNDEINCQYQYGIILTNKEDELEQIRGIFWKKKAEYNGYKYSSN
jgi:hypothetical protein